jgi:hypothetical protein
MSAMQNVINYVVSLQGIEVTLKRMSDSSETVMMAAQSNYFRRPLIDEQITGTGRSYVISAKDLGFIPTRGDQFIIGPTEYYSIDQVDEMRALGKILGYRIFLT